MESAQTPPPGGSATPPPAGGPTAPPPRAAREETAGVGLRIGAGLLALVLAFACAVFVSVMVTLGDTGTCDEVLAGTAQPNSDGECFDGSSTMKAVSLVFGWPGAILAGVAALLALAFAVRGRGGRMLLIAIAGAVLLIGLSMVFGSI